MSNKKDLKYYLSLPWSYTIEQEGTKSSRYYIIRVNELPGVCTDAETLAEAEDLIKEAVEAAVRLYIKNGEEVPEPIKKSEFKGNIAYRTTSERHYYLAKAAKTMHKSISKTIDEFIDAGLDTFHVTL